jgi:hydrogenase maturation protease
LKGSSILLIGLGNEFRGDDSLGVEVIRQFLTKRPDTETLQPGDDILKVLDYWKHKSVIVVDALNVPDQPAGVILTFNSVEKLKANRDHLAGSHSMDLFDAVELGQMLNQSPKNLFLIGVVGKNFRMGDKMSQNVMDSIPKVIDLIIKRIS